MSKADNGRLHFATGIDNSTLQADAAQSRNILQSIGKTAVQEGNNIDAAFSRVGKTIAGVFTIQQAAAFAKQVVNVRGEIESLEKSFEILAGKTQGRKLFGDIKDFAVTTPMAMGDLAKGAQTLLSFNVEAQNVMPILRAIGDIAMGDAQKFNSLVLAFSQMQSTGKLMGQDLLQMINAGFNPLSVISEQTGKSIGTLKEEMAAGSISAEMITKAFMDATSEGGKFNGMLEAQSKGIKGSISNLEGAIEDMFNKIGENSEGVITGSIQAATELVNSYEKVGEIIGELVVTYGVYKAALITLTATKSVATSVNAGWTASELLHYNALLLVEKAQKLLNATILKNPYVLAAAAVAALAYGIYKLVTYQTDAEKAQAKLNETTEKFNKEVASERVQIDSLFARLKAAKEGTDEYKSAKQAILNQYGDYLKGLSKEVQSLQDVEGAYKAVTAAAREAAKARALEAATKDAADTYAEKEADAKEEIMELLNDKFKGQTGADGISLAETYYWKIVPVLEGKQEMTAEVQGIINQFERTGYYGGGMFGGGGSYQYNPMQNQITAAQRARGIFDNTMAEANRLYGGNPQAGSGTEDGGKPTEVVKNKKYWEDYKKEQQGLLDAMTAAQLQTKEAKKIRANIAEAQKQIDAYSVTKGTTAANREQKEENTIAVQTAERNEKIRQYGEDVAREARQAELDIEQARIDGMQEGLEKELAQNELNYKRLTEANLRRQEEMVEALRDKKQLEWENANPKAKEQGLSFDRSSVTAADLSSEQLQIIREYERIASDIRAKANKDSLDKALSEFMTYEQKRTEITEDYERKRKALYVDGDKSKGLREGVTQGNIDELNTQEQNALTAIDEQFAQREASYQAWCEAIANLSLQQLQGVLEQAEKELKKLEESGTADGKQIAVARAKVATAKSKVEKANAQNDVAPNKRSIEQWNDLRESLDDCCKSFDEIGDAVGGVAGEIISTTGNIMASTLSMINGIVQLVNMSATGMQGTATAAETAISTVEKASVILAVISAAMQIAMQIINLFNNDDKKQEEIEALQDRIDQLQWELDNADAVRLQNNSFKAMDMLRKATAEARQELVTLHYRMNNISGVWGTLFSTLSNNNQLLQQSAEKVAKAYANIAYTEDKAIGGAKYSDAKSQLENIAKQQLLIQEQIRNEEDKKKTDHGKIEEWEQQIQELGEQAVTIINEMVEDIIGGSSEDIAKELGDAFFEAFKNGEDYAEAWGDKVKDIVADVMQRMLVSKFLEEPLGEIFNKYKEKWFKDGQFVGLDAVINSMSGFAADLNSVGEDFAVIWESLPDSVKNMFTTTAASREASQEGIATASQESVDELNGRATAIQGHTYSISENTKQLVATAAGILESVLNIEMHTERISARMEKVEENIRDVKSTVEDIVIKGIKIQ